MRSKTYISRKIKTIYNLERDMMDLSNQNVIALRGIHY